MPWPNLFLAGAVKAGTTSLYHYLKAHPSIYMSPLKEPNFFSRDLHFDKKAFQVTEEKLRILFSDNSDHSKKLDEHVQDDDYFRFGVVRDEETYLRLFEGVTNESVIGEATPTYLFSRQAPKLIAKRIPDAKIIIMLRNPIERAYSHYMMNKRFGLEYLPLKEAIMKNITAIEKYREEERHINVDEPHEKLLQHHPYIEMGLYCSQIKRYWKYFSKERVKIYLFDDLKQAPLNLIQDIYAFLEVDPNFIPSNLSKQYNKATKTPRFSRLMYHFYKSRMGSIFRRLTPRSAKHIARKILYKEKMPRMTQDEWRFLSSFFQDEIEELSQLLSRDLSEWLIPPWKSP